MTDHSQLAARIRSSDLERLAALRTTAGVEVMQTGSESGDLWLRGGEILRSFPHLELAALQPNGGLVPLGKRVPSGRLPADAVWIPLAEAIRVNAPASLLPGQVVDPPVGLQLVRGEIWTAPELLRCDVNVLRQFVEGVSTKELAAFQFAMNPNGEVLVRNVREPTQLPLAARRSYNLDSHANQAVARPCGWDWSPRMHASVLVRVCGLAAGQMALFDEDGTWEKVLPGDWMNASRSAVRLSCQHVELAGGEIDGD